MERKVFSGRMNSLELAVDSSSFCSQVSPFALGILCPSTINWIFYGVLYLFVISFPVLSVQSSVPVCILSRVEDAFHLCLYASCLLSRAGAGLLLLACGFPCLGHAVSYRGLQCCFAVIWVLRVYKWVLRMAV